MGGVIKAYLGITSYVSLQKTLKGYDQKKLTETYNYFKNIYSGNAYSSQILTDGGELYKFIMSPKQPNMNHLEVILLNYVMTIIINVEMLI